jgi:2-polyprenyl-3-methyl-5-hydroxy-6-metoxy-1,4-benzoquinol methylase
MKTIDQISHYLSRYNLKTTAGDFISVVSNIYHDFESKTYDESHVSIKLSDKYWKNATNYVCNYFKNQNDLLVLDFGCCTGFASEQIIKNRNLEFKISKLYCYDLSESMIAESKKKFDNNSKLNFYSDKDGFLQLLEENKNFDLVVCNALLHHILEPEKLLVQFSELINKDGILIIGHEPNKLFYQSKILQFVTQSYRYYKRVVNKISNLIKNKKVNFKQDLTTLTYCKLLEKNLIDESFPKKIIPKLVDIHVPMGDLKKQPWGELGFNADYVVKNSNNCFALLEQMTYNHIKDQNAYNSLFWSGFSKILEFFYPKKGADTFLIFKRV